jgi:hypothetical protein
VEFSTVTKDGGLEVTRKLNLRNRYYFVNALFVQIG